MNRCTNTIVDAPATATISPALAPDLRTRAPIQATDKVAATADNEDATKGCQVCTPDPRSP